MRGPRGSSRRAACSASGCTCTRSRTRWCWACSRPWPRTSARTSCISPTTSTCSSSRPTQTRCRHPTGPCSGTRTSRWTSRASGRCPRPRWRRLGWSGTASSARCSRATRHRTATSIRSSTCAPSGRAFSASRPMPSRRCRPTASCWPMRWPAARSARWAWRGRRSRTRASTRRPRRCRCWPASRATTPRRCSSGCGRRGCAMRGSHSNWRATAHRRTGRCGSPSCCRWSETGTRERSVSSTALGMRRSSATCSERARRPARSRRGASCARR